MTAPAWTEPADADGNIDDTTIAIVERPGNRRADGYRLRGLYG